MKLCVRKIFYKIYIPIGLLKLSFNLFFKTENCEILLQYSIFLRFILQNIFNACAKRFQNVCLEVKNLSIPIGLKSSILNVS